MASKEERQEQIREKGFSMNGSSQYGKIKVGTKILEDAVINLGTYPKLKDTSCLRFYDKVAILRAIAEKDIRAIRAISDFFYRTNGIYQRIVNYYSTMYRYDWYTVPTIYDDKVLNSEEKSKKVTAEWFKVIDYLDNTNIREITQDITFKVIKYGVCYGYLIEGKEGILFQELPVDYCRCRYYVNNLPAIEFNMAYFDQKFHDVNYRMKVLKMFPKDIQKGYVLWKERKLTPDFEGDTSGWYLLDPGSAVKFSLPGTNEIPFFINVIPYLLDLDAAQDLDHRKQLQDLLKVIVQKLPIDKNGDLIFDVDEARDIHNNAVAMLQHAIGTDVITTFADVESIDLSDTSNVDNDDLERVERSVYNAAGVSKNLFNSDTNLSINNSILQDEGLMRNLKLQFEKLFDTIIQRRMPNRKKYTFRFYILDTTQYNYKELSKMYKEQMTVGFGKMLAQIALGHTQNSILATAFFENDVLSLSTVMIPPMMSSTIGSEDIQTLGKGGKTQPSEGQNTTGSDNKGGRPAKEATELSDKTIQNKESQK